MCCAANVQVANLMSVCTHLYTVTQHFHRFKQSPGILENDRAGERENTQVDEMCVFTFVPCMHVWLTDMRLCVSASREQNLLRLLQFLNAQFHSIDNCVVYGTFSFVFGQPEMKWNENKK